MLYASRLPLPLVYVLHSTTDMSAGLFRGLYVPRDHERNRFYRAPPDATTDPVIRLMKMKPEQLCSGLTIHLFTQQYWLEGSWRALAGIKLINPKTRHITFRHIDWWHWEEGEPIVLDPKQRGRPVDQVPQRSIRLISRLVMGCCIPQITGARDVQART